MIFKTKEPRTSLLLLYIKSVVLLIVTVHPPPLPPPTRGGKYSLSPCVPPPWRERLGGGEITIESPRLDFFTLHPPFITPIKGGFIFNSCNRRRLNLKFRNFNVVGSSQRQLSTWRLLAVVHCQSPSGDGSYQMVFNNIRSFCFVLQNKT